MFGAGPVGLMAAYSAKLQGASKIFSVDGHKKILDKAKSIGAIPINRHKCDPVEEIISQSNGEEGVDRGVDAVGYQASSTAVKNILNAVRVSLVNVVRHTGGIGSPSLYVTEDPGASDEEAKQGTMQFPIGKSFEKGLTMGAGQCNVKRYNRYLRDLIIAGVAKPSFVVSHEIKIDETPVALKNSIKELKVSKVLIHPQW